MTNPIDTSSVLSTKTDVSQQYSVFPNPFKQKVTISFECDGFAELEIFDGLGKKYIQIQNTVSVLKIILFGMENLAMVKILIANITFFH